MEKTTRQFRAIASTLAELNAEGLSAQTVNGLFAMYVGAASQHVLRMSFVPEHEARTFDTEVTAFWSQLIKRDATSPLFHVPLKLGGLGVGSAVPRHAAAPWRAWQSVLPTLVGATQSPDTDTLFTSTPRLRAQLVQPQITLSQQMNKPALLLKPLGPALRTSTTKKRLVTSIQKHLHKHLLESHATPPIGRAILISQSAPHTGAHVVQPNSEAYESEDRCFRVSIARRLKSPHPTAPPQALY